MRLRTINPSILIHTPREHQMPFVPSSSFFSRNCHIHQTIFAHNGKKCLNLFDVDGNMKDVLERYIKKLWPCLEVLRDKKMIVVVWEGG